MIPSLHMFYHPLNLKFQKLYRMCHLKDALKSYQNYNKLRIRIKFKNMLYKM